MDLNFVPILLLLLLVVTIVGHGVWVLFAAIFGAIFRADAAVSHRARRRDDDAFMRHHGAGPPSVVDRLASIDGPRTIQSLQTLQEQVNRFLESGLIDPAAHDRVSAVIVEELRLARGEVPAAEPAKSRETAAFADIASGAAADDVAVDELEVIETPRPAEHSPVEPAPRDTRPPWLHELESFTARNVEAAGSTDTISDDAAHERDQRFMRQTAAAPPTASRPTPAPAPGPICSPPSWRKRISAGASSSADC